MDNSNTIFLLLRKRMLVVLLVLISLPQSIRSSPARKSPRQETGEINKKTDVADLLNLMNTGKMVLHLNTDDPNELIQIINEMKSPEKAESIFDRHNIKKFLEKSSNLKTEPDEKKLLVLSGEDDNVHVELSTEFTFTGGPYQKGKTYADRLEMVMEKDLPTTRPDVMKEKIMIIEKDKIENGLNKEKLATDSLPNVDFGTVPRFSKRKRKMVTFSNLP